MNKTVTKIVAWLLVIIMLVSVIAGFLVYFI